MYGRRVGLHRKNLRFEEVELKSAVYRYGDSSTPLRIKKAITVPVNSKKRRLVVKFYVLDRSEGPCGSVLGSTAAKRLGLLRVGEIETEVIRQLAASPREARPLGKLTDFQLDIPIDEAVPPVAQPCRRVPFAFRKPLSRHLKELRAADIIEPVTGATPWVSPVVPVVKKNGDMRLCVDMRRANEAVLRENFPIPTFDELVAEMRNCEVFSKIDLKSAYHQVELTPRSRAITTFTTPDGIFRFKRLFFGIKCAPEMFQRIMQSLLQGIPNVRVFFDDIIVFSKSLSDHKIHVAQVIDALVKSGLVLNREKSIFGVKQITFLGHRLAKNEIRPTEDNAETIRKFSIPSSKQELQSFLGLTNYVSHFIPNYSVLTEPLRQLLKKGEHFKWSDRHKEAFESLKNALADMKLSIFDPKAHLILMSDASQQGLGAVLLQRLSPGCQPEIISFASRSLSVAERKFVPIELEALAIIWACERFRLYTLGCQFEILTDNKPLESLFKPRSKPNARLERWILRLQCFDFKVGHIKGSKNLADIFSRLGCGKPNRHSYAPAVQHAVCRLAAAVVPRSLSLDGIRRATAQDPELQEVLAALNSSSASAMPLLFLRIRLELANCDGVLLRGDRIVPPSSLRPKILELAHEGHPGMDRMKQRLRTKVWWPRIDSEVEKFVKACPSCLAVSRPPSPVPITPTQLPCRPWEYVAMDFLGPLPSGKYVFVIIDYFSRFMEVFFSTSTSSESTLKLLWQTFSRHGFPCRAKTDNATNFVSRNLEDFFATYGIAHITSPPLWPQANGEVERQNRSLLKRLKIAQLEGEDAEIALAKYLLAYNNTPHPTAGKCPAQLMFQRTLRDQLPLIDHPSVALKEVAERDAEKKLLQKEYADSTRRAAPKKLEMGDLVLIQAPRQNKLSPRFDPNPFVVVGSSSPSEVILRRGKSELRRSISAV